MTTSIANSNFQADTIWDGVWVAIPAFNEVGTIRGLVEDVLALCPRVIVVDDGSTDGTAGQLQGLPVVVLTNRHNKGKADCLRTAFGHALKQQAQCVISMDADGQHNPADAPKLLLAWRKFPDRIVIGARLHDRHNFPSARYYANCVARFWVSWAAGCPIADSQSGFRVYPRQVMQLSVSGRAHTARFTFESEVLIEAGQNGWSTIGVAIPGYYHPQARPSYFRPVADICNIVAMVAGRLLRRGMAPLGLIRSLRPAPVLTESDLASLEINTTESVRRPSDEVTP